MTARCIAAFDFDGTILRGDAVLGYLLATGGPARTVRALLVNLPGFLAIKAGKGDRNKTKRRLVRSCLKGVSVDHAATTARSYVDSLTADRLFPQVMDRVAWHKSEGHECVLVSASLSPYIDEFARRHGFDAALCTQLEAAGALLTGELAGQNVRANEKAHVLNAYIGVNEVDLWAYGNSPDDNAMLAMANHAFRVDKSGHVTQEH